MISCIEFFIWISEIMNKLVKEGVISKAGGDTYVINRQKVVQFLLHFDLKVYSVFLIFS